MRPHFTGPGPGTGTGAGPGDAAMATATRSRAGSSSMRAKSPHKLRKNPDRAPSAHRPPNLAIHNSNLGVPSSSGGASGSGSNSGSSGATQVSVSSSVNTVNSSVNNSTANSSVNNNTVNPANNTVNPANNPANSNTTSSPLSPLSGHAYQSPRMRMAQSPHPQSPHAPQSPHSAAGMPNGAARPAHAHAHGQPSLLAGRPHGSTLSPGHSPSPHSSSPSTSQQSPQTSTFASSGSASLAPATSAASLGPGTSASSSTATSTATSASTSGATSSAPTGPTPSPTHSESRAGSRTPVRICGKCGAPLNGQFVRALGNVYHLDCFKCADCGTPVANKFFPVEADGESGRAYPLCERDYFRRLGLLCSSCGQALRGSYITALDNKYHIEHFTCSVCPTVFGPQDSYYEHDGRVYCHFHYSTRFAGKCTGCHMAILKQYVEINRNNVDEHWHPKCYMIHKFWNIKLAPGHTHTHTPQHLAQLGADSRELELLIRDEEARESPESLRAKQDAMEDLVLRIWTVLSAFEESSAACIQDMLRHVSSPDSYTEAVRLAERFVWHVEALFCAIDYLSFHYVASGAQPVQCTREARSLCKKIVAFFSLLSQPPSPDSPQGPLSKELVSLVTGLAHFLKILIRVGLSAALKLERDLNSPRAVSSFLSRFDRLNKDPLMDAHRSAATPYVPLKASRKFGYKALTHAVGSIDDPRGEATTDLCVACRRTIEDDAARFKIDPRWHLACVSCSVCLRHASRDKLPDASHVSIRQFLAVPNDSPAFRCICTDCAQSARDIPPTAGFLEYVSVLEQYAFLLCVALNKLYGLVRHRAARRAHTPSSAQPLDAVSFVSRAASIDRKLSTTRASHRAVLQDAPQNGLDPHANAGGHHAAYSDGVRSPTDPAQDTVFTQQDSLQQHALSTPTHAASSSAQPSQLAYLDGPTAYDKPIAYDRPNAYDNPSAHDGPNAYNNPITDTPHDATTPTESHMRIVTTADSKPVPTDDIFDPARAFQNELLQSQPFARRTDPHHASPSPGASAGGQPPSAQAGRHSTATATPTAPSTTSSSHRTESGITLSDIPLVIQVAEERADRRLSIRNDAQYVSALSGAEYVILRHAAALMLLAPESGLRADAADADIIEYVDPRKSSFWSKLFKSGDKTPKFKKKGLFGIPLEVLIERHGTDSAFGAAPDSHMRVPVILDDILTAMHQMDLSVEGIFRKNGNIRRLRDFSDALDRDPALCATLAEENPIQIAALLKKFLRELPEPLMTFRLYPLFVAALRDPDASLAKQLHSLHLVICLLPRAHRDFLEALCVFLKWVAQFAQASLDGDPSSKMDILNLATVMAPNIFVSRAARDSPTSAAAASQDDSLVSIRIFHLILEHQHIFWKVPQGFDALFAPHARSQLSGLVAQNASPKDIFSAIEPILRPHTQHRVSNTVFAADSPKPFARHIDLSSPGPSDDVARQLFSHRFHALSPGVPRSPSALPKLSIDPFAAAFGRHAASPSQLQPPDSVPSPTTAHDAMSPRRSMHPSNAPPPLPIPLPMPAPPPKAKQADSKFDDLRRVLDASPRRE